MIPLGILASSIRVTLTDALLAPTNLAATLVGGLVKLAWTDLNTDETGHRIYRSSSPMDMQAMPLPVDELGPNVTEWEDTDTPVDQVAYYIVSAVRGADEAFSGEVMIDTAVAVDPYWDNVVALLHFDDNFLETSGKTECNGFDGASISKSVFKFGEGSLYLDGAGPYATLSGAPLALGVGDFTIEMFARRGGWSDHSSGEVFLIDTRGGGSNQILIDINNSTQRRLRYYVGGSERIGKVDAIHADFSHVAVSRGGGVSRMFVDGVSVGQVSDTFNITATTWHIGGRFELHQGSRLSWNGNIDELRITKGVARYTEDFTPPTEPFPNVGPPL